VEILGVKPADGRLFRMKSCPSECCTLTGMNILTQFNAKELNLVRQKLLTLLTVFEV
jgi:hypothetical protein